jgi:hypothetical protein
MSKWVAGIARVCGQQCPPAASRTICGTGVLKVFVIVTSTRPDVPPQPAPVLSSAISESWTDKPHPLAMVSMKVFVLEEL